MSFYIVSIIILVGIGILNSISIINLRKVVESTAAELKAEIQSNKDSFRGIASDAADNKKSFEGIAEDAQSNKESFEIIAQDEFDRTEREKE